MAYFESPYHLELGHGRYSPYTVLYFYQGHKPSLSTDTLASTLQRRERTVSPHFYAIPLLPAGLKGRMPPPTQDQSQHLAWAVAPLIVSLLVTPFASAS